MGRTAAAMLFLSSAPVFGHTEGDATARRLGLTYPTYPTIGQQFVTREAISHLDVTMGYRVHFTCLYSLVLQIAPADIMLFYMADALNLTKWSTPEVGLASLAANVDEEKMTVTFELSLKGGGSRVYSAYRPSKHLGSTINNRHNPFRTDLWTKSTGIIDAVTYNTADDFSTGVPEREADAVADYVTSMLSDNGTTTSTFVYQRGKLVGEGHHDPSKKDALAAWETTSEYSGLGNLWPMGRVAQGKLDLDEYAFSPELAQIEKRSRNLTARNMMEMTIGRPIEMMPASMTREMEDYDIIKLRYGASDWGNYAAMSPSSYDDSFGVPLESGKYYWSFGSLALLQREARFTFPEGQDGLSDYIAYPWTRFFSKMNAKSPVLTTDATGVFVPEQGIHMYPVDVAKLASVMAASGKWKGEQLIPEDWIHRIMAGEPGSLANGWMRMEVPGAPAILLLQTTTWQVVAVPALDLAICNFYSGAADKRSLEAMENLITPLIMKMQKAWPATTSTTAAPRSTNADSTTEASGGAATGTDADSAAVSTTAAAVDQVAAAATTAAPAAADAEPDLQASSLSRTTSAAWIGLLIAAIVTQP